MSKNKQELTIKVDGKEWENALDKAFKNKIKEVKVDGFRKGKVPREIYEKKYGKESLYMDAVDHVIPVAFDKVMADNDITPVIQPNVDIKEVNDKGVELVFSIITKPEMKIKKYKGLKINKPEAEVTSTEVDLEIKGMQQQYAEVVLKDGNIEKGDIAVIDFEGFKDGEPFEGGKAENHSLEIGSNSFIPGFEEQLIGLTQNDEKELELVFPEDYPSEDLQGQKVMFKVKVNEVKTRVIPELNEDFYKDLDMEVSNEEELTAAIKKDLIAKKQIAIENAHLDNVLEAISKEVEVDIPEEMVNDEVQRLLHQFEDRIKMQGMTVEQYYQLTGTSTEQLKEKHYEGAKKVLLYRLMIEEVAKLEEINITDEEVSEEVTNMAQKYQMTEEDLLKSLGNTDIIKYDLKMRRAADFLQKNN